MTVHVARTSGTTIRIPAIGSPPPPQIPATPTISPNGGTIGSAATITLVSVGATDIYYTIDGSTPTTSSAVYAGPFSLAASATVKAFAVNGAGSSAVASASFTVSGGGGGGSLGEGIYETSDLTPADAYITAMWGGETNTRVAVGAGVSGGKSWVNNPGPVTVSRDTANEASAIHDFLNDIFASYVIGMSPPERFDPVTNTQLWTQTTFPYLNKTKFTSKWVTIEDHLSVPVKRVEVYSYGSADRRHASWHMATNAQMWAGFRIPDGLQPTDDSDSTLSMFFPNWTIDGNHGVLEELWGGWSPEQAQTAPKVRQTTDAYRPGEPITTWATKSGGRIIGVNDRISGRPIARTDSRTDVASRGAPAAPWDPILTTQPSKVYWGYGEDGLAEATDRIVVAGHLPISHLMVTMRDLKKGKINHTIGLALQSYYAGGPPSVPQPSAARVWPSLGNDGSSRSYFRNGHRLRFAPGTTKTYPAGMPTLYQPLFDVFFQCLLDYGTMLIDTAGGSGWSWRAEPGIDAYLPAGFNGNTFIKYLFQGAWNGTQTLQLVLPGSDTAFYS